MAKPILQHPFDTLPNGSLAVQPPIGWETAPVQGMAIVAKLQYATSPENAAQIYAGTTEASSLQLIVTPDQADELAQRLHQLAAHIRAQRTPPKASQN